MLKDFEISIEENMSLLVRLTQKVTNTGEDDHPIEVNADKIVSVREGAKSAWIKVENGSSIRVAESAKTIKDLINTAEIKRAVQIQAATPKPKI
ncbi:MAG: hypothetical protein GY748_25975 [Planctomycetaceae bacterium]|nr:hypothetical protein [Planctomycetaceae bacterium]